MAHNNFFASKFNIGFISGASAKRNRSGAWFILEKCSQLKSLYPIDYSLQVWRSNFRGRCALNANTSRILSKSCKTWIGFVRWRDLRYSAGCEKAFNLRLVDKKEEQNVNKELLQDWRWFMLAAGLRLYSARGSIKLYSCFAWKCALLNQSSSNQSCRRT